MASRAYQHMTSRSLFLQRVKCVTRIFLAPNCLYSACLSQILWYERYIFFVANVLYEIFMFKCGLSLSLELQRELQLLRKWCTFLSRWRLAISGSLVIYQVSGTLVTRNFIYIDYDNDLVWTVKYISKRNRT